MSYAQKDARRRYNEKHCLVTWAIQVTEDDKAAIKRYALEKACPVWQAIHEILKERRESENN